MHDLAFIGNCSRGIMGNESRFLPCMEVIVSSHDTHDFFQSEVAIDIKSPYMGHVPRPPLLCWHSLIFAVARLVTPRLFVVKSRNLQELAHNRYCCVKESELSDQG